jgi:hypothetical protein
VLTVLWSKSEVGESAVAVGVEDALGHLAVADLEQIRCETGRPGLWFVTTLTHGRASHTDSVPARKITTT